LLCELLIETEGLDMGIRALQEELEAQKIYIRKLEDLLWQTALELERYKNPIVRYSSRYEPEPEVDEVEPWIGMGD
jgi:hypothetical protein